MDVHRARFVPYPTHSISCLAFTRSNDTNITSKKLAVRLALARTDGSIEIWSLNHGAWLQELVIPGDSGNAVDGLVWTQEPDFIGHDGVTVAGQYRLFSTGSSAKVTEWNLETGTVKRTSTGNFAEVWCIAAQPRSNKPSTFEKSTRAQDLVIGCGNGTLALLTTDGDDLQFSRFLARVSGKKARCMTVTYQKPDVVVAGFADSMIRIFDTRSGNIVKTMSLGASKPGAPKISLVWKVLSLKNGDIVSADSNGEVRVYDGKILSLTQRLNGHDGDCLDLAASSDGKTFFSAGVDGRIACYKQSHSDHGRISWSKVSHRKVHKEHGPVKTLAAYDGNDLSVLVAGGAEPAPIVAPLEEFGKQNMRSLPYLPQQARLVSSPAVRLVASWWENTIYLYRINKQNTLETLRDETDSLQRLEATIKLDTSERIRAVAIAEDGDLIAASTNSGVRVFQLAPRSEDESALRIRRLKMPRDFDKSGARLLAMSGDASEGVWLAAVDLDNEVRITKLIITLGTDCYAAAELSIELERQTRRAVDQTGFRAYNDTITQLTFSDDAGVLVTGDIAGHIDSWELDGDFDLDQKCVEVSVKPGTKKNDDDSDSDSDDEDSTVMIYGQTWKSNSNALPKLESTPLVLTFRPLIEQNLIDSQLGDAVVPAHRRLLVVTARHQLYEFDLREGRLTDWSRRNPSSSLPTDFAKILDRVMGAYWDPRERLWLYGSTFVCMLDVSDDLPESARLGSSKRKRQEDNTRSKKRKKSSGAGSAITNGTSTGGPQTALRVDATKRQLLDLTNGVHEESEDDDALAELGLTAAASTAAAAAAAVAADGESDSRLRTTTSKKQALQHWTTFKYRPILGMAMLDRSQRLPGEVDDVLEVVIVERPVMAPVTMKKKQRHR